MNILVIGATGFIGSAFVKYARGAGHHVTGCGVGGWGFDSTELFPDSRDYWDMAGGELPGEMLDGADCLVMLAAIRPYKDFCFADYEKNVSWAQMYMDLAAEHGIENYILASSKAVYSRAAIPWREADSCVPSSLYGASKLAVEQLGMYYSSLGKFSFRALRFAQVIGMQERKGYLINTLIDNAVAKKPQTIFGTGEQARQYVYVKDVSRALLTAAEAEGVSGIFNIGIPGRVSNLGLAEAVNAAFHNEGNLVFDAGRPMVGHDDEMDVAKAEEVLGFRTAYGIRETFEDIAKAMKAT